MYISNHISLSISLSLYIYIYIHMHNVILNHLYNSYL